MAGGIPEAAFTHRTVLLTETVDALQVREGGRYVDCTLGGGGHSELILQRGGHVLGLDRDPAALAAAGSRLGAHANFRSQEAAFSALAEFSDGGLDGVVADLGVSSPQLDVAERGFSFRSDGPLDMRMGPSSGPTAADLLEDVDHGTLAGWLKRYGEERHAGRIAGAILDARPFSGTAELAQVVADAMPGKPQRIHPATRTFQALRIVVNDELGELEALLEAIPALMAPGGRVAIISFHSLEARIVKQTFQGWCGKDTPRDAFGHPVVPPRARAVTRKAVKSADDNPRARSAQLRVVEWIA